MSTDDAVRQFVKEGFKLAEHGDDPERFLSCMTSLTPGVFVKDYHVPDLLVFAAGTDFHDHPMYKDGRIILQDKASCLPAYLLNTPPGSTVIDCCAAPGNKTSHAAAIMENEGKIFAFDLDKRRAETMRKLCARAGASCVEVKNADFLQVDPSVDMYADVHYAIVDPSCSGSGIAGRLNILTDDEASSSAERIENLSKFQISILTHAMKFPNVQRVVYSTCSVHAMENEHVVHTVLSQCPEFDLVNALSNWSHRGLPEYEEGAFCLRADGDDFTNGFFVAVFQRIGSKAGLRKEKFRKRKLMNENETDSLDTSGQGRKKRKRKRKSASKIKTTETDTSKPTIDDLKTDKTAFSDSGKVIKSSEVISLGIEELNLEGKVIDGHHENSLQTRAIIE